MASNKHNLLLSDILVAGITLPGTWEATKRPASGDVEMEITFRDGDRRIDGKYRAGINFNDPLKRKVTTANEFTGKITGNQFLTNVHGPETRWRIEAGKLVCEFVGGKDPK